MSNRVRVRIFALFLLIFSHAAVLRGLGEDSSGISLDTLFGLPKKLMSLNSPGQGEVAELAAVSGRIYALGRFQTKRSPRTLAMERPQLVVWDGLRWELCPFPSPAVLGISAGLSNLYVLGDLGNGANQVFIGSEEGWQAVGGTIPSAGTSNLFVVGTNIYLSALLPKGSLGVRRWDGMAWTNAMGGFEFGEFQGAARISAMAQASSGLIVAGKFLKAGSAPARNIARWDAKGWHPVGEGLGRGELWENGVASLAVAGKNLLAVAGDSNKASLETLWSWDGRGWQETKTPYLQFGSLMPFADGVLVLGSRTDGAARSDRFLLRFNGRTVSQFGPPISFPMDQSNEVLGPSGSPTRSGRPILLHSTALCVSGTNIWCGGFISDGGFHRFPFVAKPVETNWVLIAGEGKQP